MKGVFEQLAEERKDDALLRLTNADSEQLQRTCNTLQGLLKDLKAWQESGRLSYEGLQWPSRRKNLHEYIKTLERIKSWLILVVVSDTRPATTQLTSSLVSLDRKVDGQLDWSRLAAIDEQRMRILKWLNPLD